MSLRFLKDRVDAPVHPGAWPDAEVAVPEDLRTYPGEIHDRPEELRFAKERPLHEFFTLHPEANEALAAHGAGYLRPVLPRLGDAIHRLRRADRRAPAAAASPLDAPALTAAVRSHAREIGVSRIGIAAADPVYTFAETDAEQHPTVIVCLVEQDWARTQAIPSDASEEAAMHAYVEGMTRTAELTTFLKGLGYQASPQGFLGDGIAIHYAVQAGLGQLGLNGQLLTPDAPLVCDEPVDYGLHAICDECRACVRNCPVGAIPKTRRPYRGVTKSKLNTARCLPVVVQASGCGICMKVCPIQRYGLPAVLEHRARTGAIRGVGEDELEGYDWPLDGRHYGPGETPHVDAAFLRNVPYDADRREPPEGVAPLRFVGRAPTTTSEKTP